VPTTNKDHLASIIRHKWLVLRKCVELGLTRQGVIHDLSKFRPDEFVPYAQHDFGGSIHDIDPAFERAVWHHYTRNPHHWQHWLTVKGCKDTWLQSMGVAGNYQGSPFALVEFHNALLGVARMPDCYALEMLADWWAVAKERQPNNKRAMLEWYDSNKGKIILNYDTRRFIEAHIEEVAT
jgi:hypothetical protein